MSTLSPYFSLFTVSYIIFQFGILLWFWCPGTDIYIYIYIYIYIKLISTLIYICCLHWEKQCNCWILKAYLLLQSGKLAYIRGYAILSTFLQSKFWNISLADLIFRFLLCLLVQHMIFLYFIHLHWYIPRLVVEFFYLLSYFVFSVTGILLVHECG